MPLAKSIRSAAGDWLQSIDVVLFNRLGSALTPGQVAVLDITQSEAETTSPNPGAGSGSVFANVIAAATARRHWPTVVALEEIPDNAFGRFRVWGVVQARVNGDTNFDAGDLGASTNAQRYVSEIGASAHARFLLLEDAEAAESTKLVFLDGLSMSFSNPAA